MFRYHAKSLFRDLNAAIRGKGPWFEVKYHVHSIWSDLVHPFRVVRYGLENLYAYVPLIWHDRDWDYSFMLSLWELKFRRMAHQHLVYGHHVDHEKMARQLRVCAELCARIRDDKYADAAGEKHDKKWGEMKMVTLPKRNPNACSVGTRFIREFAETDKEREQERKEFMRYIRHAEQQRANDLKLLGDTIAKNCLNWWD
jgi:hypothetical protein